MAETAISLTQLVLNTASADIDDAAGTVAATPADGWAIDVGASQTPEKVILKFVADGSGDTVVLVAGDNPPAKRAGLGNLSITLAANDVKYIAVEGARFLHDDNKIRATCADAGTKCNAFALPAGIGGGAAVG